MAIPKGILDYSIQNTPITVVDLETTGLYPGADRVVEMSVVRVGSDHSLALVFDTLINPCRRMGATEIHGITADDVVDAPTFAEVAADFLNSIAGTVVCAYNASFDIRFLEAELANVDWRTLPPHFCLMYLRPLLGLGDRCPLHAACSCHGIHLSNAHMAAADAQASAQILLCCLSEINKRNIQTYKDLTSIKRYKFMESFKMPPLNAPPPSRSRRKSRFKKDYVPEQAIQPQNPFRQYWDLLTTSISDLEITDDELLQMRELRSQLSLDEEQIRYLHAKIFASVLGQFGEDRRLDNLECRKIAALHKCLQQLGWAPGAQ